MRKSVLGLAAPVLFLLAPWPEAVRAATLHTLFKSGDAASDGVKLDFFLQPIATSATVVAFRGTTSAVMTKTGATFAVVAKTGDPLPAPLAGTFNTLRDPAINDGGVVVFRANVNSPSAEGGVFLFEAGVLTPIFLETSTVGARRPPDINNNGDVVYTTGAPARAIYLWMHSGGSTTLLVAAGAPSPGGGVFSTFGDHPVVNDAGVVAFEGEVTGGPDGIFTWVSSSVAIVALAGNASPIGGTYADFIPRQGISINGSGAVAFAANITLPGPDSSGVFLRALGGPTIKIAQEGDAVGSDTLTGVDREYVGVDSSGNVAFEGIAAGRKLVRASGGSLTALTGNLSASVTDFAPRLTNGGRIIWRRGGRIERYDGAVTTVVGPTDTTPIGLDVSATDPSINNVDVAAFAATHETLYVLGRGTATHVATAGDPSPGTGAFADIGIHAFRGPSLAFFAFDGAGRLIAIKRGKTPLARVVGFGDPSPLGGTLDVQDPNGEDILDVRNSAVFFESSVSGGTAPTALFRADASTGAVETLVKAGDAAPGGALFSSFDSVLAMAARRAVFTAGLDDGRSGIFMTSRTGPIKVAEENDPAPGTGGAIFSSFGPPVVSGTRILFAAQVSGGTTSSGLFLWNRGAVTKVMADGDPAPGADTFCCGGVFGTTDGVPRIGLSGGNVAFFSPRATTPSGFFLSARSTVKPLVLDGDPTPLGGLFGAVEVQQPISLVGRTMVFEGDVTAGAGVAFGLFNVRP